MAQGARIDSACCADNGEEDPINCSLLYDALGRIPLISNPDLRIYFIGDPATFGMAAGVGTV